jgi:hypothetical protein
MITENFTRDREIVRSGGRKWGEVGLSISRSPALTLSRSGNFLFRGKFPGFVLEHDRDVILDRVGEAAGLADEFPVRLAVQQGAFAQRADQYVEQLAVHVSS